MGEITLRRSGLLTLESVRQDVHATIYLSNLETVLAEPVRAELALDRPGRKYRHTVNRAVSFHAVKSRIIELLLSGEPVEETTEKIRLLFRQNPQPIRPNRASPRQNPSGWRS